MTCAKIRAFELDVQIETNDAVYPSNHWMDNSEAFIGDVAEAMGGALVSGVDTTGEERIAAQIQTNWKMLFRRLSYSTAVEKTLATEYNRLNKILAKMQEKLIYRGEQDDVKKAIEDVEKELKIQKQKLELLRSLQVHLMLQKIMLSWTFLQPSRPQFYNQYEMDRRPTYKEAVQSLLRIQREKLRFAANWHAPQDGYKIKKIDLNGTEQDGFNLVVPETPVYSIRIPSPLYRNYRVMELCEGGYFPGIGSQKVLSSERPDATVELLIKKQNCLCRSFKWALQMNPNKGYYTDEGVVTLLRKEDSELRNSCIWTMNSDEYVSSCATISENVVLKSSNDNQLLLTTADDDEKDTSWRRALFDRMTYLLQLNYCGENESRRFGRGVWYFHDESDVFSIWALQMGSKNVVVWTFTPTDDLEQMYSPTETKIIIDETFQGRNFNHKDTLAVVKDRDEDIFRLYVCYCQDLPVDKTSEEGNVSQFFVRYDVRCDLTAVLPLRDIPFTDTDDFGNFSSPVLLGISADGKNVLLLDEMDPTYLYLYQPTNHPDLAPRHSCDGRTRLQVRKSSSSSAMVILDACFKYSENKLFLHICTPVETAGEDESIEKTEHFRLDVYNYVNDPAPNE